MGAGQVCSLTSLQCAHLRKPADVCERHFVIGMKLALAHQSRVSPAHSSRGRGKTVPPCIRTVVQRDVRVLQREHLRDDWPHLDEVSNERDRCSGIDERFGRSDRSDGAHISRVRVVGNYQCDLAASPAGFGTGRSRHYASGCREQASERTHRRDSRQWPRRDACAGCLCSTAATGPGA